MTDFRSERVSGDPKELLGSDMMLRTAAVEATSKGWHLNGSSVHWEGDLVVLRRSTCRCVALEFKQQSLDMREWIEYNQSTNQSINQSINQPINQSTIRSPINQYIINNYSYPSPFIIRNTEEETTNTSKDSFFLCYFDLPATLFDLHFVAANLSGTGTYHTKALQNTSVVRIHGLPPKAQQKVDG